MDTVCLEQCKDGMATSKTAEPNPVISGMEANRQPDIPTTCGQGRAQPSEGASAEKPSIILDDETYKSKLKSARGRLESSKASFNFQKSRATSSNHHVSFTGSKSKTLYQLPVVYFVVKADKMPCLPENYPDRCQRESRKAYAAKSRHQFLTRRREKKRQHDANVKQVKALGSQVGLKVEQMKTNAIQSISPWPSRQPTTPFNSLSERSDVRSQETVFVNGDNLLDDDEKSQASGVDSEGFNRSQGCHGKPHFSAYDIELPDLKCNTNRSDSPDSCSSKKVHFSKNVSGAKGCNIQLPRVDQSAEDFIGSATKQQEQLKEPTRSKLEPNMVLDTTSSKPRRATNPLKLPKIDMLSPIYDELILKTFQTFMTKKTPLSDRTTRALLQRVTAILHPMDDDPPRVPDRKTPSTRPQTRQNSFFSTEPEACNSQMGYIDVSSSGMTVDGKSMSMLLRDVESRQRRLQLQSTCFQMVPPGLNREHSESMQTLVASDKRPEIYIPSC
ncbi:uncharacterized protein LOC124273669 [Haliotis rubra]|uniref:uncharacterized protein LOC124273669 n=1 Tax=Haliotis rubra TaxID=36100 RepID=UPI001EE6050A|nr:uncharacterized protein LOC124273669 [Haliotis rubra]